MLAKHLLPEQISINRTTSIIKDDKYNVELNQIVYLDIETICDPNTNKEAIEKFMPFVIKKIAKDINISESSVTQEQINNFLEEKGAFYPEINQIVCVSVGTYTNNNNNIVLKSFVGENEKNILIQLNFFLNWFSTQQPKQTYLAGHNIKFFDIPILYKKMLKYNIAPHTLLNGFGKKPWDIKVIDTFETFKAMGENLNSSLSSLAAYFSIEGKSDEATQVLPYFKNKNFESIATYCEQDVQIVFEYLKILHNLNVYEFSKS